MIVKHSNNSYQENIQWLEDLNQNIIVPGLERIEKLMHLVGNPQEKENLFLHC